MAAFTHVCICIHKNHYKHKINCNSLPICNAFVPSIPVGDTCARPHLWSKHFQVSRSSTSRGDLADDMGHRQFVAARASCVHTACQCCKPKPRISYFPTCPLNLPGLSVQYGARLLLHHRIALYMQRAEVYIPQHTCFRARVLAYREILWSWQLCSSIVVELVRVVCGSGSLYAAVAFGSRRGLVRRCGIKLNLAFPHAATAKFVGPLDSISLLPRISPLPRSSCHPGLIFWGMHLPSRS